MAAPYYRIVGIAPGRVVEHERKHSGAPSEQFLVNWGKRQGCVIVGRYYPTLKGWRVLKIDRALKIRSLNGRSVWKNYGRGQRVYPSEHAMVMHCMALLGAAP